MILLFSLNWASMTLNILVGLVAFILCLALMAFVVWVLGLIVGTKK
jgi:hypothetical protein